MDKPRLIGLIKMSFPRIFPTDIKGVRDMVSQLAVDDTGGLWALVVRSTPVDKTMLRMTYNRFQKLADVPFVSDNPLQFFDMPSGGCPKCGGTWKHVDGCEG